MFFFHVFRVMMHVCSSFKNLTETLMNVFKRLGDGCIVCCLKRKKNQRTKIKKRMFSTPTHTKLAHQNPHTHITTVWPTQTQQFNGQLPATWCRTYPHFKPIVVPINCFNFWSHSFYVSIDVGDLNVTPQQQRASQIRGPSWVRPYQLCLGWKSIRKHLIHVSNVAAEIGGAKQGGQRRH